MAHMTVELRRSHGGEAVETLQPRGANISALLPDHEDLSFPLLRLVDPYDDTEFSSSQMLGLIPELERLYQESNDPLLRQVIGLADLSRTHGYYLAFIGD